MIRSSQKRLFVQAGYSRRRIGRLWIPDGLHVWWKGRGVHMFWSSWPLVEFDRDPYWDRRLDA